MRSSSARRPAPWLPLGAALVASACGFGPEPSFTGRRIGDGIAPWQDLGPLELCLANRRIAPPGAAAGGYCVGRDTPNEATCLGDDDCRSRERCLCRRCTVQFCTTNDECGPGRLCKDRRCDRPCAADGDCARGEVCLADSCRSRCGATADCQTGELCNSQGRCVVDDCASDDDCPATDFCKVQREPRDTRQPTALAREDGDPADAAELALWVEMTNEAGTVRAIWRAESDDGLSFRFDPASPVIEEGAAVRAPSAVRVPGGLRLYFEGPGGLRAADSPDGKVFDASRLVFEGDLHAPAAVTTPAGDALVFAHWGDRESIVLALEGDAPQVVLAPADVTDPILWRQVERLGSPFALLEEPAAGDAATIRLWFDAFGTESASSEQFGQMVAIPPNDSIGFASAPLADPAALVVWPFNPVFDRVVAFLEHRADTEPAVVRLPNTESWLLYYVGAAADGTGGDGLRVARNPAR